MEDLSAGAERMRDGLACTTPLTLGEDISAETWVGLGMEDRQGGARTCRRTQGHHVNEGLHQAEGRLW